MRIKLLLVSLALVLVGGLLAAGCAPSAGEWPQQDIRVICPWGVGGGTDGITRNICHYTEEYLPASMYIENLTGAVTAIGIYDVMSAKPDGYTIASATWDSVTTCPRKKEIEGFDLDKLYYLCNITTEAYGLVSLKDGPWENLDDLIADAKQRPGEITCATCGLGGVSHIYLIPLEELLGIELRYVPYDGAGAQMESLLSGECEVVSLSLSDAAPIFQSDDAVGLAVAGIERNPLYPDCPTFKELGYDIVWGSFNTMVATAGTPQDRLDILEEAFDKGYHSQGFLDWTKTTGVEAAWMDHEETVEFISGIRETYNTLLEELIAAGIVEE